ncbi:MAG: glycosyltransferase [Rickettsiales bacterium]
MRIANIMLGKKLGGIERSSIDYALGQRHMGNDVYMISDPDAAINHELTQTNIPFQVFTNMGPWDPFAPSKLRSLLKHYPVDCIIAHGSRAITFAAKAKGDAKVIAVSHNYRFCSALAEADAIFAVTRDMVEKLIAYGISEDKIIEVPNMITLDHGFIRRTWNQKPVIGTLGRFEKKKGFDLFIEALRLLRDREIPFQAVLGGAGEEETNLRHQVARHDLENFVSFPGWIEDPRAFLKTVDIFCLPSRHEPFGIVLLEAMAAKLPIVATDSEGPREILKNGESGILVPRNQPEALAGALQTMISQEDEAREMARHAYDTVKTRYSMEFVSQRIDLVLREVCGMIPINHAEALDS